MLIDTHCHLADPAFVPDRAEVLTRMRAAGVGRALVVESVLAQLDDTLAWTEHEPELGVVTGCHPHDATAWDAALAARLQQIWMHPRVYAAGEMGLDYHYNHAPRELQRRVFSEQLALATSIGMPVVIHAREADADVVAILREQPTAKVVLHSFSSGPVLRDASFEAGWYLSFSGMITFKWWTDLEAVRGVAPDRMLVETDAPYLAPVPHRGKRNEPGFVVDVARKLAELRGESPDAVATRTTANAERLFWSGSAG